MTKNITTQQYKEMQAQNIPHVLLDVRGKIEWDEGHIEGAVLLPHFLVPLKAVEMFPYKELPVVVYCQSGARSQRACESLESLGYKEVFNLIGGFENYKL